MGESVLGVMSNYQPLQRLKFENGLVDLIARRCVDGAKLVILTSVSCRTFLAWSKSMIVILEKSFV